MTTTQEPTITDYRSRVTEDTFDLDLPQIVYPDGERLPLTEENWGNEWRAWGRWCKEQYAAGRVGVYRRGDTLHFRFRDRTDYARGSSVEGCGYTDEFVRHLARRLRDERG